MQKLIGLLYFLLFIYSNIFTQEFETLGIEKTVYKCHLIPLGLSLEQRIYNNFTILGDVGSSPIFVVERWPRKTFNLLFQPYLSINPRLYLNLYSRNKKGKTVRDYSGYYVALKAYYGFETQDVDDVFLSGSAIGFQRSFGKYGYFNLGIGIGLSIINNISRAELYSDMCIGVIINDKN